MFCQERRGRTAKSKIAMSTGGRTDITASQVAPHLCQKQRAGYVMADIRSECDW